PDINNKTLLFARSVVPGLWIPMAYINGGGMCLKWYRDLLVEKDNTVSYQTLDQAAEGIPAGSEGLIFLPHFSGRVCPNDPNVRGTWLGLSWIHTRNHLYKSIMEGIAYEYNYYLKILKELIKDIELSKVIAIGGGAKSKLFNSIKADVLGVKYFPMALNDTATLGSATVAGYGVKAFSNMESAVEMFKKADNHLEPDPKRHREYQKYAEAYEKVFSLAGSIFKTLSADEQNYQ
ncbi:MAG: FGGY-family carbohydrate kinase, partial [Bacteroidota bacterium]